MRLSFACWHCGCSQLAVDPTETPVEVYCLLCTRRRWAVIENGVVVGAKEIVTLPFVRERATAAQRARPNNGAKRKVA